MNRKLWTALICAGCILGLSVGFRQALGLFLTPVSEYLATGRETFALGMGLMNLLWGLGAPFAGALADRFGAAWVIALGGLAYGAGLAVMTLPGTGEQLLVGGVLIGLGLSGSGFTVILGTIGRITPEKHRSTALGLASVGGSIGQFMSLPYTHVIIDGYGWSSALLILGATACLIVPLAYGLASKPVEADTGPEQKIGEALRAAFAIPSFWLLNAGFFVCGFHLAFVGVHLPGFLSDRGFDPWLATVSLTIVGLTNIAGSYACGVLGGKYSRKNLLSLLYLARAAIFLLFILTPVTELTVMIFSAAMGFLWLGTVPLTSGLVGHIFGTRYMSMLFGIVFMGHQFGGFLGSWIGGYAYDTFGSYDAMWWLSIALGVASAAIHWPISEKPVAVAAA